MHRGFYNEDWMAIKLCSLHRSINIYHNWFLIWDIFSLEPNNNPIYKEMSLLDI